LISITATEQLDNILDLSNVFNKFYSICTPTSTCYDSWRNWWGGSETWEAI